MLSSDDFSFPLGMKIKDRECHGKREVILPPGNSLYETRMDIFLIDAIGPFFRGYRKRRINWSKIPFAHFHREPEACRAQFTRIASDLDLFCTKVSRIGYNSVSLDDVAHLTPDHWIESSINAAIAVFQQEYRSLFAICSGHGLDIYLTMDVLSLTPALREWIGRRWDRAEEFLVRQVDTVLGLFPEISGLIVRIGECDGGDVAGDFLSELLVRTPKQLNRLLRSLLPVFERHRRRLILRTWTVGAYPIGDFIWHGRTLDRALEGIDSPFFILSMKHGESDFFRYLPLNRQFFRYRGKKILELQARREYEGAGEYPAFIGREYWNYAKQLATAENMAGISVWCQTGGWLPFRRLSFLEPEGLWNEINACVILNVFRDGLTVEEAVHASAPHIGCSDPESLAELLRLSEEVICEGLYIGEIASRQLYFRRSRIPPLLNVYWDSIFISHPLRKLLGLLCESGEDCVTRGRKAVVRIERMEEIAKGLGLPTDDLRFMADTFGLLALAREYYFLPFGDEIRQRLKTAKRAYKERYPKACGRGTVSAPATRRSLCTAATCDGCLVLPCASGRAIVCLTICWSCM